MCTNFEFLETFLLFSIDFLEALCYNIDRKREGKPRETQEDLMEVNTMTNTDKMIDMIAESCEIALGDEWHEMDDQQKHDTIMEFAKYMLAKMN